MTLPKRTIRLRLTLAFGGLLLASSAALLGLTYVAASHQYNVAFFVSNGHDAASKVFVAQAVPTSRPSIEGTVPRAGRPGLPITGPRAGHRELPVPPGARQAALLAAAAGQSKATLHTLLLDSSTALVVMAILSLASTWLVSGRALRPLRTMRDRAREISASNLHRRLALTGPDDELQQLGNTIDDLLGRLERSFVAQRQFAANVSHELRTPLTFERTLIEVALADPNRSIDSLRSTCEQLLIAGEQQERLIEALLTLSRSQRGLTAHDPVDLAKAAETAVAAADHHGLAVTTSLQPAQTSGDQQLVDRLVANLVGNAIRHNVRDGRVDVVTDTLAAGARLVVSNSGPVIAPEELARLFRPFERLEADRTATDGVGLGLSIVDAIAEIHGAVLTPRVQREGGLRIEVVFPSAGLLACT